MYKNKVLKRKVYEKLTQKLKTHDSNVDINKTKKKHKQNEDLQFSIIIDCMRMFVVSHQSNCQSSSNSLSHSVSYQPSVLNCQSRWSTFMADRVCGPLYVYWEHFKLDVPYILYDRIQISLTAEPSIVDCLLDGPNTGEHYLTVMRRLDYLNAQDTGSFCDEN